MITGTWFSSDEPVMELNKRLKEVQVPQGAYLRNPTVERIHYEVLRSIPQELSATTFNVKVVLFIQGIVAQFPLEYSEGIPFVEPSSLAAFFSISHREVLLSFFDELVNRFLEK